MIGRRRKQLAVRTPEQIRVMRAAGLIVAEALEQIQRQAQAGMTTRDLDDLATAHIRSRGAKPNFAMVPGYHDTVCVSVNEEVVHGIPGPRVLAAGDLVSVDCGCELDGWNGDAAVTFVVGGREQAEDRTLALLDETEASLYAAIAAARAGARLFDIGAAVDDHLDAAEDRTGVRFGIVEEYTGHGIGEKMHLPPHVPNYRVREKGPVIPAGFTVAIEPIVTLGTIATHVLADEWTVVTNDKSLACHWEHTVAVLEDGPWVLTALDGGRAKLAEIGVPLSAMADG